MTLASLSSEKRLFVALDYDSIHEEKAQEILEAAGRYRVGVKVGTQITATDGWINTIDTALAQSAEVFADTKVNDIPATVSKTVRPIFERHPAIVNMHANAGYRSMEAFLKTRTDTNALGSLAIAVTVLTSKDDSPLPPEYSGSLDSIGELEYETSRLASEQTVLYALLAARVGMDGVVCSASDLDLFAPYPELQGLYKVTPGIRPLWAVPNDQARIETPLSARQKGATHLVIGRPITEPPTSIGSHDNAIEAILEEMAKVA